MKIRLAITKVVAPIMNTIVLMVMILRDLWIAMVAAIIWLLIRIIVSLATGINSLWITVVAMIICQVAMIKAAPSMVIMRGVILGVMIVTITIAIIPPAEKQRESVFSTG